MMMQLSSTSPFESTYDTFPFASYSLLVKGKNHDIIDCGLYNSIPILCNMTIHEQKEFDWKMIQYIHRSCNQLLAHGIKGLVPTYGFISCPSPLYQSCGLRTATPPVSHVLIQKRLFGNTLHYYITEKTCTLGQLQDWLHQLFSILVQLEESSYQFYHNDLHLGNIFIEEETNQVYLLDLEVAECWMEVQENREEKDNKEKKQRTLLSYNKRKYCGTTTVLSGAYDMYLLFYQLSKCLIEEIASMATSNVTLLLCQFSIRNPLQHAWLYNVLEHYEKKESDLEKQTQLYKNHMEVLQRMTYAYCIALLFPTGVSLCHLE